MPVTPLDTLLAFKAIALMQGLSAAEMRVAAVVIDHYRRRDGRCDPSIDTIAFLAQSDRGTVFRAVKKLHRLGLILRDRHGGRHLSNNYEPTWTKFRELEAAWKKRRKQARARSSVAKLSGEQEQDCHLSGGEAATQTCSRNLSKEPAVVGDNSTGRMSVADAKGRATRAGERAEVNASGSRSSPQRISMSENGQAKRKIRVPEADISRRQAAAAAAERRWFAGLHHLLSPDPVLYGIVIDAIDDSLRVEATEAEMNEHGGGLRVILEKLKGPGGPLEKIQQAQNVGASRAMSTDSE